MGLKVKNKNPRSCPAVEMTCIRIIEDFVCLRFYVFKTRCSVAERSVCSQIQGGKLFDFREKRNEFFASPLTKVSRGEPQAKLLGAFSLDTFFGVCKESINKDF